MLQGISCLGQWIQPCTFLQCQGAGCCHQLGADARAGTLGPWECAQVSFSARAGCWPCIGVQRDGWHSWSNILGHQQGEEGTKQTLLGILLCANFVVFFFFAADYVAGGSRRFLSSGNVPSLFAWVPTFGPLCSAPVGCQGHSVPSFQHWTLTRLSPCPHCPCPQSSLKGCACHCSPGGTKPSQNELLE